MVRKILVKKKRLNEDNNTPITFREYLDSYFNGSRQEQDGFEVYLENQNYDLDDETTEDEANRLKDEFLGRLEGVYNSEEDFAREMADQFSSDPDFVERFIYPNVNWNGVADDLRLDGYEMEETAHGDVAVWMS